MNATQALKVVVAGDRNLAAAVLSRTDGGSVLDRGVREIVAAEHPGTELTASFHEVDGLQALRTDLESGSSSLVDAAPDVVILTLGTETGRLDGPVGTAAENVAAVRADLVAVIEQIKERAGAHVLVMSLSTIDPNEGPTGYGNLKTEPFQLRAQRLDLMLVGVSHDEGVSVIDADRLVAELGAGGNLTGPGAYGPKASASIAAETARILADYGFFDDRQVMAQVGARHAGS